MAIEHFIPEIWSPALLSELRDRLVYAQGGMINRNYEGEIARAGDTVRITSVSNVAVRSYTRNAGYNDVDGQAPDNSVDPISYDLLSDTEKVFQIEQQDYFAFQVDDIDVRQALPGFVEEATQSAAYGLAAKTDTYVSGVMSAAVPSGNISTTTNVDPASPNQAYDLLVDLRTKLVRSNTPDTGRWVVVPPEFYAVLLHDDRFIRQDASGTTSGLRNGQVGRAAGFDVIEANVVPESSGTYTILAGHAMATTFADQITKTEALRLESGFSDAVRGLHVYDAMAVRPELLAKAAVTIAPEA